MDALQNFFNTSEYLILHNSAVLIFAFSYPRRIIQIQIGYWNNFGDILAYSDLDCTAVAFDGCNVWAAPRAQLAINTRINTVNLSDTAIRKSHYAERLYKYSKRGFGVVDPHLDRSLIPMKFFSSAPLDVFKKYTNYGKFMLLLYETDDTKAHACYQLLKQNNPMNCCTEIPYGPTVSFEDMTQHLYEFEYIPDDGYGSESGYCKYDKTCNYLFTSSFNLPILQEGIHSQQDTWDFQLNSQDLEFIKEGE